MRMDKRRLGGVVAAVLVVDACLHLLWSTGVTWPVADARLLSYLLLGFETSFEPRVTLPLAAVLVAGAAAVWGAARSGNRLGRAVTVVVAVGLACRGAVGLVWVTGVGTPRDYPAFYWLNLFAYTPLCLVMAGVCLRVLFERRPSRVKVMALAVVPVLVAGTAVGAYAYRPATVDYDPARAGVHSRFVDTDVARFHYTRQGSGPAVVLLSPGSSWAFAWRSQARALAKRHTVYVVDLPGQGFTTLREPGFAYDLDAMTRAVHSFMDGADLGTVAMGGNSWSGGWALAYAAKHPDRVDRLALLAPSGADRPDPASWEMLKTPIAGELFTHLYLGDREAVAASLRTYFVHDERLTDDLVDAAFAANTRADNVESMYLLERGLDWARTEELMPDVEQPTLLIWGEKDSVLPYRYSQTFTRLMPDTRLAGLDDCGHALTLDCPQPVNELLTDFLA